MHCIEGREQSFSLKRLKEISQISMKTVFQSFYIYL